MFNKRRIILIFCILIPLLLYAQNDSLSLDTSFNTIDKVESNNKKDNDIEEIKIAARKMMTDAGLLEQKAIELNNAANNLDYEKDKDNIDKMKIKAKQLQEKAEQIREKALKLYESANKYNYADNQESNIEDKESDEPEKIEEVSEFKKKAREVKDTIQLLTKEGAKAFLNSFIGKKRGSRKRGYGGGLGPVVGLHTVNLEPVKELIPIFPSKYNGYKLALTSIHGNYDNFLLIGGLGYGGIGNGFRIGGGGRGGSRSYSVVYNDTTWVTKVSVGYGGFLAEKCFIKNRANWFIGGMIGGGNISVTPSYTTGVFEEVSDDNYDFNELKASFMLLEFHGGFTYTMVSWLHIGMDISTPFFLAPDGFKNNTDRSLTNGFMTINPGLRIRFILGNIG